MTIDEEKEKDFIVTTEEISDEQLEQVPEYYISLPNNASPGRLRELDVKINLPYIVEYVEGRAASTAPTLEFQHTYHNPPLVLGLIETTDLGERVVQQLLPDGRQLTITNRTVTINGINGTGVEIGDYFRLRVYSLDV